MLACKFLSSDLWITGALPYQHTARQHLLGFTEFLSTGFRVYQSAANQQSCSGSLPAIAASYKACSSSRLPAKLDGPDYSDVEKYIISVTQSV